MSTVSRWVGGALVVLLVAAYPSAAAKPSADSPENGQKTQRPKGKNGAKRARPSLPERGVARADAPLPKNLEWSKPKKIAGRTNLPLIQGKRLGEPLSTEQLDGLLRDAAGADRTTPMPAVSDDLFLRRAFLDVIGELPAPADIQEFLSDASPDKRARLVDKLLALPQYGRNWARYWRDVVWYRSAIGGRASPFNEEEWLAAQFNENVPWDKTVRSMLTARGLSSEAPEGFFIAALEGKAEELAGEASRIFMGVQISCAQCHDHPTEAWKRDQFHELASFFGRVGVRRRRDLSIQKAGGIVLELSAKPAFREYRKPDLQDPSSKGEIVPPVFLSGQSIPREASDSLRRDALATFMTSTRNASFAKAFVNRLWCELTGAGFVMPVDDLGSGSTPAMPKVFEELSRSFAASGYDVKALFRVMLTSEYYARPLAQSPPSGSSEETMGVVPTRLASDTLFDAIDWVLGDIDDGPPVLRRRLSPRGSFKAAFGFDPSTDPNDLEGSITQALLLMNHPKIEERIRAETRGSLLEKCLKTTANDQEAVEMLYLRVLARRPTKAEVEECLAYVRKSSDRAEGFEDVLWALLNSTEFLHNH